MDSSSQPPAQSPAPASAPAKSEEMLFHLSPEPSLGAEIELQILAREVGDEPYLAGLKPVDQIETAADWQRKHYREKGSWKALVDDMAGQLTQDLEGAT
jgi:hypothetical protein